MCFALNWFSVVYLIFQSYCSTPDRNRIILVFAPFGSIEDENKIKVCSVG